MSDILILSKKKKKSSWKKQNKRSLRVYVNQKGCFVFEIIQISHAIRHCNKH